MPKTQQLTRTAALVALSAVGSLIRIPSFLGSVALDAAPAYYAALKFGPLTGALVAALGHLITALMGGLPLSLPIHLAVALMMAGAAALLAKLARPLGPWLAGASAVITNGIIMPAALIPFMGLGFFWAALGPLCLGALINVGVAVLLHRRL